MPYSPGTFSPSPWLNCTYDSNDLAPITTATGSNVPSSHEFTPKSAEVDALGRTIKTTEHIDKTNPSHIDNIEMNYLYDIRGNLLVVTDPYQREVFRHVYDLRPGSKDKPAPPLKTMHIDKGTSTVLFDALGKPIESFDAKGAQTLSAYDVLQRPTHSWAKNDGSFTSCTLRNYVIYGESAATPATYNLNGKAYQSYDEAGFLETPSYDFKGNLLTKNRQVFDSTTLKTYLNAYTTFIVDWTSLPSILDSTVYETDMEYDALNRITKLTLPQDLDSEQKQIIPTYNKAGALEKVDLYSPTGPTTTNYVESIAYNAKGQRLMIAFGNQAMTRYTYDPITFRLQRQRTEKYTKTTSGSTITYAYNSGTRKQDDGFNYDLIGNIVNIFHRTTDCGLSGNPDALDREFDYDAIYRLAYADGREANTQSGASGYIYNDAPDPGTPNASNARFYSRTYDYDKLGNVKDVIQGGTNGFTRHFVYNTGVNTLLRVEDSTPTTIETYTYDSCGNTITSNLNRFYYWNHADQLICYKNGSGTPSVFTQYDYSGQNRVSKLVKTGTDYERTIYIDGIFEYVKLENGITYEKNYIHIMDDKSRIAEVRIGSAFPVDITDSITYHIEDQIGSSSFRLSTLATIIDKEEYYPFGDSSLRTFTYKRYRYVGKEKDAESGLYYYGARYYVPWLCRFMSVDPKAGQFPNQSSYNYCFNNPLNLVDKDGKSPSDPGDGDKNKTAGGEPKNNPTTNSTEPTGNYFKNLKTGQVEWREVQGEMGSEVSLKGSKDTWKNLGSEMTKDVIDAVGGHIFNGGGFKAFLSYYENPKFGEKAFFNAAADYYPSNASGFMGTLTKNAADVKSGIEISVMTHSWIDNSTGGWTREKNALEHHIGMFLLTSRFGPGSAWIVGTGNEVRGLVINDEQSGNMKNAILGNPTSTGGPTAFEWSDFKENTEGRKLFNDWATKNPTPEKFSTFWKNMPKAERFLQDLFFR